MPIVEEICNMCNDIAINKIDGVLMCQHHSNLVNDNTDNNTDNNTDDITLTNHHILLSVLEFCSNGD